MKENRRKFLRDSAILGLALLGTNAFAKGSEASKIPQTLPRRILGDNFSVSALGLGCMGMTHGHGPARDEKEMIRLIHEAIELGVDFFDTAEIYGPHTNEILLGKALKPYRHKVAIGTKFGLYYPFGKQMQDSSPKSIRRAVEGSLKRLQSDYIDIYTQHRVDPDTPIEEVAQTMKDLAKEGKIRHYGLSEPSYKTIEKAHKIHKIAAIQSQYSMMFREPESNKVFETCKNLNIGFVAYSPLDRGFLAGLMNENTTFHKTLDMRATFPRFSKEALRKNQIFIDFIKQIDKQVDGKKATPAQIALAWILAQRNFIVPIPETTKISHLRENLGALKISFSNDELAQINAELSKLEATGTRYPIGSDMEKSVGL